MKLAIRGYTGPVLIFEEHINESTLDDAALGRLAMRHAERMLAYEKHMIEIEFLDEPDPLQRFLRFGVDPSGMVQPIRLSLLS
jgi:hypothetical protein